MSHLLLFSVLSLIFIESYADNTITCASGFGLVNQNKCLKVFPNHFKHQQAEQTCTGFGGTLVTVKTAIDNRAVVMMAANAGASYTWLGMFCFGNDTSTCYHDDNTGNPMYSNFQAGFPKVDSRFGGCVYMATTGKAAGQWLTGPCEVTGFSFICETPTTFADSTCKHNYNGYCYLPSHEMGSFIQPNNSFVEGTVVCSEYNAKLVSVHSKREVDYIRSLYKNLHFPYLYLGAQATQGVFQWVDGSQTDYDYTDPLALSNGNCLQMDISDYRENNGMWSQVDCEKSNYFLCKRPIGGVPGVLDTKEVELYKRSEQIEPEKAVREVNPKFKLEADSTALPDFSQCNATIYLAPGTVTSFGYPGTPISTFCTWKLAVLGPYRLGMYFTDFSVVSEVNVYDEYGRIISRPFGNKYPFQVLAPTNIVTMTHDSRYDAQGLDHGFEVEILPF